MYPHRIPKAKGSREGARSGWGRPGKGNTGTVKDKVKGNVKGNDKGNVGVQAEQMILGAVGGVRVCASRVEV